MHLNVNTRWKSPWNSSTRCPSMCHVYVGAIIVIQPDNLLISKRGGQSWLDFLTFPRLPPFTRNQETWSERTHFPIHGPLPMIIFFNLNLILVHGQMRPTNLFSLANPYYNPRNSNHFVLPRFNLAIGRNSLRYRGPLVWELTPTTLKRILRTSLNKVVIGILLITLAFWKRLAWCPLRIKTTHIFNIVTLIQLENYLDSFYLIFT